MTDKLFASPLQRASGLVSGTGEAPRRRTRRGFDFRIELKLRVLLHNAVIGLTIGNVKVWIGHKIGCFLGQTFWKRVGDSSSDPVLTLQHNTAQRRRESDSPKGLIDCNVSVPILVMAGCLV